jgi:hypothetical protein
MDLQHGNTHEPTCDDHAAVQQSGPWFVAHVADVMNKKLIALYSQFAPYLTDEDLQAIAAEAHRQVMAHLMGTLAEMREKWIEAGDLWWESDKDTDA